MKIVFVVPYPPTFSPSQRFRFEQYFSLLKARTYFFETHSFWDTMTWAILYKKGNFITKSIGFIKGFSKRFLLLFNLSHVDFIFIHREAAPIGPPIFEWIIARVLKKKIIYDFDDAIWLPNTSGENSLVAHLKWHQKVRAICRWSYAVSCGNKYLCEYARQFNMRVFLNPTTIDTEHLHNPKLYYSKIKSTKIIMGWTGTHSTLKYIDSLLPVFKTLEEKFPNQIEFVVVADKEPLFTLSCLRFVRWNKQTEIQDLLQFDIGLMPLTDDVWSQGKCGFKALQYLALQIPAVVSPVGVNNPIVENGVSGFVCAEEQAWIEALTLLIENEALRKKMGEAGRKKVIENYSVLSNSENFLSLFL